ncbi:MAG: ubiquinol-cytochrome c reductase iron-sulfur subunit [Planctomycetales bacterium]
MQRRGFFKWVSLILSGLSVAFVAIPGVGLLIEPLRRQARRGARRRLLKLAELEPGVPRKVVIQDRRIDAWTKYPQGAIGAVWVVRRNDRQVDAFSVSCPHLGCPVDHLAAEKKFYCPCHEATFDDEGRTISGPPQRGLDRLETSLETVDGEEWVHLVFERFEPGVQEKISLG